MNNTRGQRIRVPRYKLNEAIVASAYLLMKLSEEENYDILHILPKRSIIAKPTKLGKYPIFILTPTYLQLLDRVAKCFAGFLCMFSHLPLVLVYGTFLLLRVA